MGNVVDTMHIVKDNGETIRVVVADDGELRVERMTRYHPNRIFITRFNKEEHEMLYTFLSKLPMHRMAT